MPQPPSGTSPLSTHAIPSDEFDVRFHDGRSTAALSQRRASLRTTLTAGLAAFGLLGRCDAAPSASRRNPAQAYQETLAALPARFVLMPEHHEAPHNIAVLGLSVEALSGRVTVYREANVAYPVPTLRRREADCEPVTLASDRASCAEFVAEQVRPRDAQARPRLEAALARQDTTSRFAVFTDPGIFDIDRALDEPQDQDRVVISVGFLHATGILRPNGIAEDLCTGFATYQPANLKIGPAGEQAMFDAFRRLEDEDLIVVISGEMWGAISETVRKELGHDWPARARCHDYLRRQNCLVAEIRVSDDLNVTVAVRRSDDTSPDSAESRLRASARKHPGAVRLVNDEPPATTRPRRHAELR
ncbi:MAG TPA: hypothetical protein VHA82_03935 [Ramlibacter sp.]|uniref:hypothetical protein n=1 Tax=Ramlibacter sp. TaxID=1917967 RepID=UPI002C684470|nr:hypothetical protein [Ramlibacter sp.]HVZ42939.1 hypothetical protein [Ramlibacter sp.]